MSISGSNNVGGKILTSLVPHVEQGHFEKVKKIITNNRTLLKNESLLKGIADSYIKKGELVQAENIALIENIGEIKYFLLFKIAKTYIKKEMS
ncbi:MAG: hypothetical protein AMS24_02530 [Chlamydiae bacterium SM23_39]|nr:MAG: hypothetical protein AMS24_02530 [Chlamydiae bacterium SM23_39]